MNSTLASAASDQTPDFEGVRFSLTSLMVFTSLCAVAVALVQRFDMIGTVALFIVAVVASVFIWHRCERPTQRFWMQAIWGVVLPLACLFTDPILFQDPFNDPQVNVTAISAGCYGFMLWQMAILCASWFVMPGSSRGAAFLSGSLFAGSLFSGGVGLVLLLPTIVFMWFVIGLPGLTPWVTMVMYAGAMRNCWKIASRSGEPRTLRAMAVLGFLVAVSVAFGASIVWQTLGAR